MPNQENNLEKVGEQVDLNKYVDGEGGIFSVRQLENIRGWNNIQYGAGLSEKNVGSKIPRPTLFQATLKSITFFF